MTSPLSDLITQLRTRQFSSTDRKVLRQLLPLLARGAPVSAMEAATACGVTMAEMVRILDRLRCCGAEFDEHGDLVGLVLSQRPTPHRFAVYGQELYAWCALDTLFLPALLGETAEVVSSCPATHQPIRLRVSPTAIEIVDPPTSVVSIVTGRDCTPGPGGNFCGQIFFFASSDVATMALSTRPEMVVLSLADTFVLAQAVYVQL